MPRFSTRRQISPRKKRAFPQNNSTPRQRLFVCLFLPVWLLVVVNAHVAIGFFQELDESVLVDPNEMPQDSEVAEDNPFQDGSPFQDDSSLQGDSSVQDAAESVVEDVEREPVDESKFEVDSQIAQKFFIEPDENGDVFGRLSALGSYGVSPLQGRCNVALVQGGKEVAKTTATNGEFLLQNVPTGTGNETYTLVVSGSEGFLAQTINIGKAEVEQSSYRIPTLRAEYVSLNNETKIAKQEFDVPDGQLDLPDLKIQPAQLAQPAQDAAAVPRTYQVELVAMQPRYTSLGRLYKANMSDEAGFDDFDYSTRPTRADLQSAACFEYELNDEGGFCGRLVVPDGDLAVREFTDMTVFLNQGSQQIAEAIVETNGDFEFTGVTPGPYGLVAAGSEGFAAIPVSLVNEVGPLFETGQSGAVGTTYVSLQDEFDPCGCCRVPLVCQPQDVQYVGDVIGDWNVPQVVQGPNFPGPLAPSPIQYQGVASGGFAPTVGPSFGGGFAAPAPVVSGGFAAPATGGFASGGFGGGGGLLSGIGSSRLARLGLAGGIVALALSGDDDQDLPASPNDL